MTRDVNIRISIDRLAGILFEKSDRNINMEISGILVGDIGIIISIVVDMGRVFVMARIERGYFSEAHMENFRYYTYYGNKIELYGTHAYTSMTFKRKKDFQAVLDYLKMLEVES